MTEKFTPGEWEVNSHAHPWDTSINDVYYEIQWSKDGELVADIVYKKEDAYLMAASKEMYRFIEYLYNCGFLRRCDMEEAEKLLQKARGER